MRFFGIDHRAGNHQAFGAMGADRRRMAAWMIPEPRVHLDFIETVRKSPRAMMR